MNQAVDPWIVDIKRNSLDDGPGIRSVVFFKGCPLACVWCQNPETILPTREVGRDAEKCIVCKACIEVCPQHVAQPATQPEPNRAECDFCGECAEVCPVEGRRVVGRAYTTEELLRLLLLDAPFYKTSGGGVTLSGGEPTMFVRAAGEIAQRLAEKSVHVLLETCGLFDWDKFEAHLLPHLDMIYFDVKLLDEDAHKAHTGKSNLRIQENLAKLASQCPSKLLARVPLIPEITDGETNLETIAQRLLSLGLKRAALLPYNPLWLGKRKQLGKPMTYARSGWMEPDHIASCRAIFEKAGLEIFN